MNTKILVTIIIILALIPTISLKILLDKFPITNEYIHLGIFWASNMLLFYGIYSLFTSNSNKIFRNILLVLWVIYGVYNLYIIYGFFNIDNNTQVDTKDVVKSIVKNMFADIMEHVAFGLTIVFLIIVAIILVFITLFYNKRIAGVFTGFTLLYILNIFVIPFEFKRHE